MAVVELGMSAPGEIRTLVAIAEPDVRVWTNVGEAHLESFPSVDAIADAKAEILEGADRDACWWSTPTTRAWSRAARSFAGRVRTFGIETAGRRAGDERRGSRTRRHARDGGRSTRGVGEGRKRHACEMPLLGRGNLANVLAGMAVGLDAGVPLPAIVERAATLAPASHRGEVTRSHPASP